MIILELFWEFLKIGMFSFGGGYGAISVIRDSVLAKGWLTEEMLGNVVAISESTPGPIMINAATYIGNSQAGIIGAVVATLGVVLPSFIIILLIAILLKKWLGNVRVQAVLGGIKPAVAGIILSTGIWMALTGIFQCGIARPDYRLILIFLLLLIIRTVWSRITKAALSPVALIVVSAVLGMMIYS